MKRVWLFVLMVCFYSGSVFAGHCPGETMSNGWCWPTGTSNIGGYMGYNGINSDFDSRRHLAQDIAANEGDPVYAIADGVVLYARNDVSFYGGAYCSKKSIPGAGVIIQHTALGGENGQEFIALYAHLKNVHVGSTVKAGEKIGEIRNYTWCTHRMDHLHFGIRFPSRDDSHRWAGYESGGDYYGFVDPINFLNTHHPKRLFFEKEELKVASFPGAENIAWYPGNKECDEAERWFKLKSNGEVEDETDQNSACSVVNQKRQEEAQRIFQAEQQAQEEAYRQELEARKNRPWWQKVVDFIKDIFKIHHTNAQEIGEELKNLVIYRTITIYTDNSGNIVDGDVGVRSGGSYHSGYYPKYTPAPGSGATEKPQPGEWDHPGYKHGVSMDDTEMSPAGSDDYHGSWTFYHGEVPVVNVRVRLKNKTNHKIGRNDVTIKWFESPNHTFNPSYDHHFATDHNRESIGPFKHNSHSDELVERKTNITHLQSLGPGIYYIYPVFYYGGEENMASKNDHGEYIKVTILPRYDVENVSLNTDKTTVTVGEGLTLFATVKNNYDSLPHDVRVGFYIDGGEFNHKLFYAKVFSSADLGTQSFTVPILAPATPGSYTISMELDDENRLEEKNENNNRRSFQLSVLDPLTVSKTLPIKVKEIIFWWLRTNRLTREKEERQRVESLKIPLKLKRQIFWLLKQNHSN